MDGRSEDLKTNEQIIEELTKDLENSCVRVSEKYSASKETNQANQANQAKESIGKSNRRCECVEINSENDEEPETEDKYDANRLDDFEDWLKDRELTLTEEQKDDLRHEAVLCKASGNEWFKVGRYEDAISRYTEGIRTCPLAYSEERSILYANRAAAKLKFRDSESAKSESAISKSAISESAISDCTKAIELNDNYKKAYVRRARLYEASDKLAEALEDFKKVLSLDPSHEEAMHSIVRLSPLVRERNEKLKAEVLGKLKDLGNTFLKPFGLSTNNFEVQKDPNSGGYSVNFR